MQPDHHFTCSDDDIGRGYLCSDVTSFQKGEYHIIAPDQGGHGRAGVYISADDEYSQLKEFLIANDYRQIDLVYGASLGVAIPDSVTEIGDFAFYGCDDLTINGKKGSAAETYAKNNDIKFAAK